jgi:ribulose-phosphate 3-epimerase
MTVLAPSILSADFGRLAEEIASAARGGAGMVHVDVMDAHFVPNLTLGSDFARAVAGPIHAAGGLVDVHLMVSRPGAVIPLFSEAADAISVHVEADPHPHRLLAMIREAGCLAGLALNPGTPVEHVAELGDDLDYVNVLAIDPGFAGQTFLPSTPRRAERLRALLPERAAIEIDGGISAETLPAVRDAGAQLFVSASSIFGAADPVAVYTELAALAAA